MGWNKRVIFLGIAALCLAILMQCEGELGPPVSPVSPVSPVVGTIGGVE